MCTLVTPSVTLYEYSVAKCSGDAKTGIVYREVELAER